MNQTAKLCVLGAGGRMGRMVLELCSRGVRGIELAAAHDRAGASAVGSPCGKVVVTDQLREALAAADVYIDFTLPAATAEAARIAAELGVAAVVGTTGLTSEASTALEALATRAPVLVSANFSLGINVLLGLAERAARALGPAFDLEIVEAHHRHKRDAPSGTALALGAAVARGRNVELAAAARLSREGDVGPRPAGEIGFASIRGGAIAGEHTAYFISDSERIELTHRAADRSIFAAGALRAAAWMPGQKPGHYTMRDVLAL